MKESGSLVEDTPTEVAIASIHAMATGDVAAFERLIHPEASNREAVGEPRDCRGTGPSAFAATSRWLRDAWSDLAFTIDLCVTQGDVVVTHGTMSGRHAGSFVVYDEEARIKQVFPATSRSFSVNQAHFFRMRDGLVHEHSAVRDDRSLGEMLGWAPPSPIYALRMMLATRSAQRQARESSRHAP